MCKTSRIHNSARWMTKSSGNVSISHKQIINKKQKPLKPSHAELLIIENKS